MATATVGPSSSPHFSADGDQVLDAVRALAESFAAQRNERQRRRELDPADFQRLRDTGFLRCAVTADMGGLWVDASRSQRLVCDLLRTLAHGDSSVALVASMHPAVIATTGWLTKPDALPPFEDAWAAQRQWAFKGILDGAQWGTIMSEPGSGGDLARTKATARQVDESSLDGIGGAYRVSGLKHFGSGSGVTRYMITSAVPEGEDAEEIFFMDMRGVPWDGSQGVKLVAPWDGHGMTATQSHMMAFEDMPATRLAWPSVSRRQVPVMHGTGGFFASVIVGIVEVAVETARTQLAKKKDTLRAFEQVEWSRVEVEAWLLQQAYEGMLRAVESSPIGPEVLHSGLLAKEAIAELAESILTRICRVVGGGAYSRYSPFGYWLEDVRALGFLRPPWGLAYDNVFAGSWPAQAE